MKKLFLCIPALAILAVACQKVNLTPAQEDVNEPAPAAVEMITETVSGTRGAATKATIADADASFAWTVGDKVAVHVDGATPQYVVTSVGADAAAASAKFTVEYETGYARDAFAVYPSTIVATDAANYGQSGHTLDLTLPGSYTLAEVSGETSPGPMISTNNAGENWDFYQLCGLLRLTVNYIPASAKRLEFDFDGKQVWGAFSIADPAPGVSAIETTADDTHDIITVTNSGSSWGNKAINLPLPVGKYTNITITAYDALSDGNAILTMTRPFAYTASNKYGTKRTASFPIAFRGYEVSTGILERTAGTPATYSLTSGAMITNIDPDTWAETYSLPAGCNPFEPAIYFKQPASLNKYFNKWLVLREELGASGDNINATSSTLPAGWQFPTGGGTQHEPGTDWGNILFGTPKSTITVNGEILTKKDGIYTPFAMVHVILETGNSYGVNPGTYYGLFLLRDGSTIPNGFFSKIGLDSKFADNEITEDQFKDLVRMGCLFISASGYYSETFNWRDLNDTYQNGHYWTNRYNTSKKFYTLSFSESGFVSVASLPSSSNVEYKVVKLVKPLAN